MQAQTPRSTSLLTTDLLTIDRAHFALLVVMLGAFALRVVALDRLGIAYDEAASAIMARATPPEIIQFHWDAAFEHPPFWVLLLHAWSVIAGQSEFALRTLPAFAGTAIVAMTWQLARIIWPRETGLPLLSAIYVALAPVLVYYSQETRMYTLVVLLLLASTSLILRLRVRPQWKGLVTFWLVCWAMLGLHYYAALALAIQAGVLGIEKLLPSRQPRMPWAVLLLAYAGALLPVSLWMLYAPGFHTTLEVVLEKAGENPVTWQYFLGDLWRELTIGSIRFQPPYAPWGYTLAPLVIVGGLIIALRPAQSKATRVGAWLLIAVVLLPILSGTLALRTLVPRYILWIVPLFYVLAALPAARLWPRFRLVAIALVILVVGVEILALQYYFGPYRKSEYREMTAYLHSRGDPRNEILLLEAPRQHLLTKYYLPATWQIRPMPTLPLPAYWPVTAPPLVPEDEDDRIQNWLVQHNGLWVSYSSEAEVDRGEFLAKYLTAVSYREHCTQWLDARLCHYVSPHHLAPVVIKTAPLLFGNELALTAAQAALYHPTPESAGLLVQLDWRAQQKPTLDYKVALRLLDAAGNVVDEANDFPIGPLLPPTTWNEGDTKPGYVSLHLPGDAAGRYRLELSVYDAHSLTVVSHAPLDGADAATAQPRTLAELEIGDTMQLLSPVTP